MPYLVSALSTPGLTQERSKKFLVQGNHSKQDCPEIEPGLQDDPKPPGYCCLNRKLHSVNHKIRQPSCTCSGKLYVATNFRCSYWFEQ